MIVIIGESGSGKSTIVEKLVNKGYHKAIDYTTREIRNDEKQQDEYCFIDKETFEKKWKNEELLNRAEYDGNLYGLGKEALEQKDAICVLVPESIKDIQKKKDENTKMPIIYIHVPAEERTTRMLQRGDSIEKLQKRLLTDKKSFKDAEKIADYTVENEDLDKAVTEILEILKKEKLDI